MKGNPFSPWQSIIKFNENAQKDLDARKAYKGQYVPSRAKHNKCL